MDGGGFDPRKISPEELPSLKAIFDMSKST
jgi:hypothetical protein